MSSSFFSNHKPIAIHAVTRSRRCLFKRMLELEVQLPREQKIIEWDKASPTFYEVKERLGNCGIAKNWCVEILRDGEYISVDDDTQLQNCKKLTVRVAPILEKTLLRPNTSIAAIKLGQPEILLHEREKPDLGEMIENVMSFIGRIYICDESCSNSNAITMKNCRGTVGLVGSSGETIGCWHTIEDAANKRALQRMFIEYPNYPKPLLFEAQIKDNLVSSELDLFVAEPCEPLGEETAHLSSALDVSLADNVHCFGFPELVDQELVEGYNQQKREQGQRCSKNELQRKRKLPTVFSGRVCFTGWKQVVADYLCFSNGLGGIVVDDYGCLKGVHVAAFRVGRTLEYPNLRIAKGSSLTKLHEFCVETAQCWNSCKGEVATFVPVHIIEEPLQLSRLHLIKRKRPHQGKKREREQLGRPCLIRPAGRNQEDDGTKLWNWEEAPPRKKLRSQQPSNTKNNPWIWF